GAAHGARSARRRRQRRGGDPRRLRGPRRAVRALRSAGRVLAGDRRRHVQVRRRRCGRGRIADDGWRKARGMVALARVIDSRVLVQLRLLGMAGLAFVVVGAFLVLFGKNPLLAYAEIFRGALGTSYGASE